MILVNHAVFFETLRNFIRKPGYTLRYIVGKYDFGTSLDMRLTEMIKEEFDLIFSTENYYRDEQLIWTENDIGWFSKEAFEEMLWWLMMVAALPIGSDPIRPINAVVAELERCYSMIQIWQKAEEKSEYQIDKLLSILREQECEIPPG